MKFGPGAPVTEEMEVAYAEAFDRFLGEMESVGLIGMVFHPDGRAAVVGRTLGEMDPRLMKVFDQSAAALAYLLAANGRVDTETMINTRLPPKRKRH